MVVSPCRRGEVDNFTGKTNSVHRQDFGGHRALPEINVLGNRQLVISSWKIEQKHGIRKGQWHRSLALDLPYVTTHGHRAWCLLQLPTSDTAVPFIVSTSRVLTSK